MWSGLGCLPGHYGLAGREGSVQSMRDERLARLSGMICNPVVLQRDSQHHLEGEFLIGKFRRRANER